MAQVITRFVHSYTWMLYAVGDFASSLISSHQLQFFNQCIIFIIPLLTAFLQLKYQGNDENNRTPFQTHPTTILVAISSSVVYCLAYIELLRYPPRRIAVVAHHCLVWSAYASVASLASFWFPVSVTPFVYAIFALISVGDLLYCLYHKLQVHVYIRRLRRYFLNNICSSSIRGTVPRFQHRRLLLSLHRAAAVQGMHSDVALMSKPSIWREALRIVNEEGSSVNFYAYEQYKSILRSIHGLDGRGGNVSSDIFVHFVGGGLAGITAASATYPLDLFRTRLAAQRNAIYYKGRSHALHTICRDEGFLGLYKGLGATLLGVGPSIAISFSVYESLRYYWHSQNDFTTFPLDLVRRRMQLEGAGGRARVYNMGLFGHILRTEGLRGLYRGIMPEYYKVVPSVGIVFMTYETQKKLLSHGIQAASIR